jgi:uncharacterized membrane protein (DUF485 family)
MATPPFSNPLSNTFTNSPAEPGSDPPSQSPRLDPAFSQARRVYRSFGTAAALFSIGSFMLYVVLSCFLPDMMDIQVAGHITLGLLCGLAQFAIMAATVWCYALRMRSQVDPIVDRFREADRLRAEQQQQQTVTSSPRRFRTW